MELIGFQIIYSFFGYLYMWIRYRNKERIKEILNSDYENSYSNVGLFIIWKPLGVLFLVLIAGLLIAVVYGSIRFGFNYN